MKSKRQGKKSILAKLLEQSIKIILNNECKKIGNLKVDIVASSIQIIKGILKEVIITAEDINYKDLFFNTIELKANDLKIFFKVSNKELKFKTDLIVNFKISFSEDSLNKILFSNNWDWIASIISKEIFNQNRLEDIKIENDQILIKTSKDKNIIYQDEKLDIKAKRGKIFLENKNTSFQIPIEDKIFFKNAEIENNLITIFARSAINF